MWKFLISKIHERYFQIKEYWRIGFFVTLIVFALLTLGLTLRKAYITEATIEIGGAVSLGEGGIVNFRPFESADQIEPFFSKYVFKLPSHSRGSCSVEVVYSVDGLRTNLTCRSNTELESRDLIYSAISRLLERHKKMYEVADYYYNNNLNTIEQEIRERERLVELLRNTKSSILIQAQIIEQQMAMKRLENKAASLKLERPVRQTQINSQGIIIVDRRPNLIIWMFVLSIAISLGIIAAVFVKRLNLKEA